MSMNKIQEDLIMMMAQVAKDYYQFFELVDLHKQLAIFYKNHKKEIEPESTMSWSFVFDLNHVLHLWANIDLDYNEEEE